MEVTWNLGKAASTTYLINVLYSTSLHTRLYTGLDIRWGESTRIST
jgi:hypothetical protein